MEFRLLTKLNVSPPTLFCVKATQTIKDTLIGANFMYRRVNEHH